MTSSFFFQTNTDEKKIPDVDLDRMNSCTILFLSFKKTCAEVLTIQTGIYRPFYEVQLKMSHHLKCDYAVTREYCYTTFYILVSKHLQVVELLYFEKLCYFTHTKL